MFNVREQSLLLVPLFDIVEDDQLPEFTESFVLYLEVDEASLDPRDRDIISVINPLVLVYITDDDRMCSIIHSSSTCIIVNCCSFYRSIGM